MSKTLFSSESVCAGHPDKLCDSVSDALLDEILKQDPEGRTGIETVAGANQICLFGEIKTSAIVNYESVVRNKIIDLGYTNPEWGFSNKSIFQNYIHEQSPEISQGVDVEGAGDQGMMFGFACKDTKDLMPLPISLAHSLTRKIDLVREKKEIEWLRPDGKAQVTIEYENLKPSRIAKIVIAVAHSEEVNEDAVKQAILEQVITPIVNEFELNLPESDDIIVNGTGAWYIPGPQSDAGLTGRKIVVDGYGGYARVGGGAFSGKDPSKVDRSGAYAARFIAKNIVAAGLAERCEIGLAYVIGKPYPLMQTIDTFGTTNVDEKELEVFSHKLIDTSVNGIIKKLDLKRPIYSQTTAYGHFGKPQLPWEQVIAN